mmetsp:Transcript_27847/g.42119  ORF Transcript_27847/g.42119 Transcript_27847/m.42119 type:complete len:211 (+) Transcript_27847:2602-3234(+)
MRSKRRSHPRSLRGPQPKSNLRSPRRRLPRTLKRNPRRLLKKSLKKKAKTLHCLRRSQARGRPRSLLLRRRQLATKRAARPKRRRVKKTLSLKRRSPSARRVKIRRSLLRGRSRLGSKTPWSLLKKSNQASSRSSRLSLIVRRDREANLRRRSSLRRAGRDRGSRMKFLKSPRRAKILRPASRTAPFLVSGRSSNPSSTGRRSTAARPRA